MNYSLLDYTITISSYFILNSSLNVLNRWALGIYGFNFPITITLAHLSASALLLLPIVLYRKPNLKEHLAVLRKQGWGLLTIGLLLAANISLQNTSLVDLSLSLNQIIRSSMPVMTAISAIFIESQVPSRAEAVSLFILTAGVMLACKEGAVHGSLSGILIAIAGTASNAVLLSLSGRLLLEKPDVFSFTVYTAPVSFISLVPFFLFKELSRLNVYLAVDGNSRGVVMLLTAGCCCAAAYNLVHNMMVQKCSAVSTTVLGNLKVLLLIVISSVLLGEAKIFTPRLVLGGIAALGGFFMFSWFKMQSKLAAQSGQIDTKQGESGLSGKSEEKQPLMHTRHREQV